jgi:hypothetical protein
VLAVLLVVVLAISYLGTSYDAKVNQKLSAVNYAFSLVLDPNSTIPPRAQFGVLAIAARELEDITAGAKEYQTGTEKYFYLHQASKHLRLSAELFQQAAAGENLSSAELQVITGTAKVHLAQSNYYLELAKPYL